MNIDIETYKKIAGDAELLKKLEKLMREGAPSAQLAQAIEDAGIDVEVDQVEEFLAQEQAKRAEVIALDEVDEEQLKKVAGGSGDEDDFDRSCDNAFFCYQNVFEQCTEDLYVPCSGYSVSGL